MNTPYGGTLIDARVTDARTREHVRRRAARACPIRLTERSRCDLELLATGAFSPLATFMAEADYRGVLREMRLADGTLYPVPVTLPVPDEVDVGRGDDLALLDDNGDLLALLSVHALFGWDRRDEAMAVCGTADRRHPLVAEMATWPRRYASGPLAVLALPRRPGLRRLCREPRQVRARLARLGFDRVVAFQTRNPMHRVHEELTKRAAAQLDAAVLIHPVVGPTRPGDVDPYTRVRCYRELVSRYYDPARTVLSLLPLAMRMAGPREAVWHVLIRRNFGATHMIVGRDHAGPGRDSAGLPFYGPYDAQALVQHHAPETGVVAVPFEELLYVSGEQRYVERSRLNGHAGIAISGTEVRESYLARGERLPEWFTRPEVARVLERARRLDHP